MDEKKAPMYGYNFSRTRRETSLDALELAFQLRSKTARYVMNEKYVPKRWRQIDGYPAVHYAEVIRNSIAEANAIHIGAENDDRHEAIRRLDLQKKAISYCDILELQLLDIINDCDGANDENMSEIIDTLDKLHGKLSRWNKSDSDRIGD